MFQGIKRWYTERKHTIFTKLRLELVEFLNENADNVTFDRRLYSLYYVLTCLANYDDAIETLNRFIFAAKHVPNSYTKSELAIFRIFKFRLESPLFWLNRIFK